jgi:hypothetical protein
MKGLIVTQQPPTFVFVWHVDRIAILKGVGVSVIDGFKVEEFITEQLRSNHRHTNQTFGPS